MPPDIHRWKVNDIDSGKSALTEGAKSHEGRAIREDIRWRGEDPPRSDREETHVNESGRCRDGIQLRDEMGRREANCFEGAPLAGDDIRGGQRQRNTG